LSIHNCSEAGNGKASGAAATMSRTYKDQHEVKLATAKPQVLPPCQKNLKISTYAVASVTQRSNKTVPVNVAIDTPRDLVMI
jgi:hypothetical protein